MACEKEVRGATPIGRAAHEILDGRAQSDPTRPSGSGSPGSINPETGMREVHAPSAERERAAIEGLLEMNQAILSGLPLRRLAVIIGRRAYAVTGASLILTCTPAADGQGLVVSSAIGHQATKLRGWTIPAGLAEVGGLPGPQPIALDCE